LVEFGCEADGNVVGMAWRTVAGDDLAQGFIIGGIYNVNLCD
jgi:hypothetical protein